MSVDQVTLPQKPTHSDAVVQSIEWMFEPAWKGERLMARLRDGRVTLTDAGGELAELAEAAEVLEPVIDAEEALVDGIWTNMPFIGEGSAARHLAEAIAEEGPTRSSRPDGPVCCATCSPSPASSTRRTR